MSGEPLKHTVLITNPEGFHMRPMTAFVQLAARFQSKVKVSRADLSVDGKSPFEMMQMLSLPDSTLTLEVEGPDAPDCLRALLELFNAPSGVSGAETANPASE